MMFGTFPIRAKTLSRFTVSSFPTTSESTRGLYFSTLMYTETVRRNRKRVVAKFYQGILELSKEAFGAAGFDTDGPALDDGETSISISL